MKLQTKLTFFNAISKLLIAVLFVALLPQLISKINQNYTDYRLKKQKQKILQIIHTLGIGNYILNDEPYGSYTPLKEQYVSIEEDESIGPLDTIQNEKRKFADGDVIEYRILSYNFTIEKKKYLLEIGISTAAINETSGPLQNIAFQVLLGMILLTIFADLVYSNYILRPLRRIIKTKLIGQKFPNYGTYKKVQTSTSDFEYLDVSIHRMIKTIESTFQKEREFISNASHELMTPISILQSKIENMFSSEDLDDDVKEKLLELQKILNRLKSITKTLLLISQIENDQFLKDDTVNVSELLHEIHEEISVRFYEKNISCVIIVPEDVELKGVNKFLLYNLLFNLVNNSIKYNKEDGEIKIIGTRESNSFTLDIIDTGIGISAEELPLIFNRFKKLKQSLQKESFGLGLPIVKTIADFHRIKIDITSEQGVGTSFKLIFPGELLG